MKETTGRDADKDEYISYGKARENNTHASPLRDST